jgi:hydrogenase-4 component F
MIHLLLILIPAAGALAAAVWPSGRTRPWLLPACAVPHAAVAFHLLVRGGGAVPGAWLAFDPVAAAVLPAVSLLFLVCSAYAVPYLRIRRERPNRVFVASLLGVLALLSAGHQARHVGLLWIAVEGVTLATVPLLHFNNQPRAFEATWKYLLVGGTGIALSLLGSFCLGYASLHGGGTGDLTFDSLMRQGPELSRPWMLMAWTLLLVGYGTKMGLVPMHTWKPDAYGEAPGIVGAMLAGGVTTVAFTALLRVRAVVGVAGEGEMADRSLLVIGILSMGVAALFLLAARDFKRMLAYSSVEHMGILALGASFGPAGVWAALFHVWSNGLTKGALFLGAGNLRRAAGTASLPEARGLAWLAPVSARILVVGVFAITACPPFGPFFSELKILGAGIDAGRWFAVAAFLACLLFAFLGMTRLVFSAVDGRPPVAVRHHAEQFRETVWVLAPPVALLVLSAILGLFTPAVLREAWSAATAALFPTP